MSYLNYQGGGDDVLDILFAANDGLLNDRDVSTISSKATTNHCEHIGSPNNAYSIDINMDDLDFLSCDFLDDVLQFPSGSVDDIASSPGNSDSGVSFDGSNSPPADLQHEHDHNYTSLDHRTSLFFDQSDVLWNPDGSIEIRDLEKSFHIDNSMDDFYDGNMLDSLDYNNSTNIDIPAITRKVANVKLKKVGTLPVTVNDAAVTSLTQSYDHLPELRLSDEEKLLMAKEGFVLPTHLPLTKEEERQLKAVRRKIRNKISAKESRKRKMTYMDGLENRVKLSTEENAQLRKKVSVLEKQNMSLVEQLKKLRSVISTKSNKSAPTGTCVMILAASFMFIMLPAYSPLAYLWASGPSSLRSPITPGNSRSLLQNREKALIDHDIDPFGVTSWPRPPWSDPHQSGSIRYSAVDSTNHEAGAMQEGEAGDAIGVTGESRGRTGRQVVDVDKIDGEDAEKTEELDKTYKINDLEMADKAGDSGVNGDEINERYSEETKHLMPEDEDVGRGKGAMESRGEVVNPGGSRMLHDEQIRGDEGSEGDL